jgi:hypothetical protein
MREAGKGDVVAWRAVVNPEQRCHSPLVFLTKLAEYATNLKRCQGKIGNGAIKFVQIRFSKRAGRRINSVLSFMIWRK